MDTTEWGRGEQIYRQVNRAKYNSDKLGCREVDWGWTGHDKTTRTNKPDESALYLYF